MVTYRLGSATIRHGDGQTIDAKSPLRSFVI